MSTVRIGGTVRLHDLIARPELNGRTGTVVLFDEAKKRYAIRLTDANPEDGQLLLKPANLEAVVDAAFDVTGAADLAAREGVSGRRERLAALIDHSASQHSLKEEAATHMPVVAAAKSRADLPDDVWDRVVDIQRLVQAACNACNAGFPALQFEAIQADDAATWSRASVEYAHYLLGQPEEEEGSSTTAATPIAKLPPVGEAQRLAKRVLAIHACEGRCRDAVLATAVLAAEGPFSRADAEALLGFPALDECPLIDGAAWTRTRERDAMQRELQAHWDKDTHERLAKKGAEMAAEASSAAD